METNELESVAGYNLEIEIRSNEGKNFFFLLYFKVGIEVNDDKNTSVTLRFRRLQSNHGTVLNPFFVGNSSAILPILLYYLI